MRCKRIRLSLVIAMGSALAVTAFAQTPTRIVGAVTAVSGRTLTIKPDSGAPSTVTVSDTARILRSAPGAKKLSDATPIAFTDLAVGDRVLVVVKGDSATTVVAMKQADIAQKQQAEAADWQRRGTSGLVKTVDAGAGTVTIASGVRTLTIHVTPTTVIYRYSPDSAQFADAKPSTLAQVHPGDELRVRGDRNADGSEMAAEEIVAGSFRNIAGTVLSINPAENTLTVNDLIAKKPIVIHITAQSQMHKLPPEMAERLAARLKRSGGKNNKGNGEQHVQAAQQSGSRPNGGAGDANGTGGSNLSQMLEGTPATTLSDVHKHDAVIIVATEGTPDSATAITVLTGVEPILSAFPSGNQSVFSASWNLNGGGSSAGSGSTP